MTPKRWKGFGAMSDGNEMFVVQRGEKRDAEIHGPILNDGQDRIDQSIRYARSVGLTENEIMLLFLGVDG